MRPLTMQDFLDIWRRRKWWFLAISSLLAATTCAVVGFLPSQYRSSALVLIRQPDVSPQFVKSDSGINTDQVLPALIQQVLSRSVLEQMPYFHKRGEISQDEIGTFQANASIKILRDTSDPRRPAGKPYGLGVSYLGTSPKQAQELTTQLANLLVEEGDKAFLSVAQATTSMLRSQMNMAAATLQLKSQALDNFKKRYAGELPVETQYTMETLSHLEAQLDSQTQAIERTRANISDLRKSQQASATQETSKVTTSQGSSSSRLETDLQTLKAHLVELQSRYKPTYPDVIRTQDQVKLLEAQVAAQAKQDAAANATNTSSNPSAAATASRERLQNLQMELASRLKSREQIEQRISQYQSNLSQIPLHTQEFDSLQRDYDGAKKDYDSLRDKVTQAELSTDVFRQHEGVHLSVQDQASLPDSPELPVRWKINLEGLAGSLFFGLAIAAFLEIRDTSMKSEEDVKYYTGLPNLAMVPNSPSSAEVKWAYWRKLFWITYGAMAALALAGLNFYIYVVRLGSL